MNQSRIENHAVDINYNCFDVIRCICTFIIFFGHFITHFNVPSDSILYDIAYFVRGVPVFFLLSGIFIARSLERYDTKEFILKRIFRIYPELWVCVLINLVIILITYDGAFSVKDILIYLGTQLTVCQFYTGGWLRGYGVGVPNGALWTITVDIQFYILAILIVKIMKNKSLKAWGGLIGVFAVLSIVIERFSGLLPSMAWSIMQCCVLPFFYIFFFGMAVWYHRDKIIPFFTKWKWIIAGIYVIWMLFVPTKISGLFTGVRYNVLTTLLLICLVAAFGFSFKCRLKVDYSYSFYLYHMVVINIIYQNILTGFNSVFNFCLCLILTFISIAALALFSKRIVSMKFGNWLERSLGLRT